MKKKLFGLAALLLVALVFVGCRPIDDDNEEDIRKELTAGQAVSAVASDTSKAVTFTGALGLSLSASDFAVSPSGTISGVSVSGNTATVSVSFAANTAATSKTYTVSIASGSAVIKGSGTVAINQAAAGVSDTRKELTAGPVVNVAASDTIADVTFTGASGLSLSAVDFAVSSGTSVTNVQVASDTATVSVTFPTNGSTTPKTYIVSIASDSAVIKGSGTIAINQAAAASDTRATLTA
jgi:hypothetical protein